MRDSAAACAASGATTSVRWGHGPFVFEIRSSDPRVLARASVVFRPWTSIADDPVPAGGWSVQTSGESGPWEVCADADGTVRLRPTLEDAIRLVEALAVLALCEAPSNLALAHGALVSRDGRGVVICGPSGAGKSTLACALWRRGFLLHGDDGVSIDLDEARAWSVPRRVALRASSQSILGEDLWRDVQAAPANEPTAEGLMFHAADRDTPAPAARVAAWVFLARNGADAGGALLVPIVPAHAALALLPYLNAAGRLDARVMARVASFAQRVPAFDLKRASISDMADAVERLAGGELA